MNNKQFIQELAQRTGYTQDDVQKMVYTMTDAMNEKFQEGDNVPVSPCGAPLTFINPEGDRFEKTFTDRRATWTYKADRDEDGWLGVWIPSD